MNQVSIHTHTSSYCSCTPVRRQKFSSISYLPALQRSLWKSDLTIVRWPFCWNHNSHMITVLVFELPISFPLGPSQLRSIQAHWSPWPGVHFFNNSPCFHSFCFFSLCQVQVLFLSFRNLLATYPQRCSGIPCKFTSSEDLAPVLTVLYRLRRWSCYENLLTGSCLNVLLLRVRIFGV